MNAKFSLPHAITKHHELNLPKVHDVTLGLSLISLSPEITQDAECSFCELPIVYQSHLWSASRCGHMFHVFCLHELDWEDEDRVSVQEHCHRCRELQRNCAFLGNREVERRLLGMESKIGALDTSRLAAMYGVWRTANGAERLQKMSTPTKVSLTRPEYAGHGYGLSDESDYDVADDEEDNHRQHTKEVPQAEHLRQEARLFVERGLKMNRKEIEMLERNEREKFAGILVAQIHDLELGQGIHVDCTSPDSTDLTPEQVRRSNIVQAYVIGKIPEAEFSNVYKRAKDPTSFQADMERYFT